MKNDICQSCKKEIENNNVKKARKFCSLQCYWKFPKKTKKITYEHVCAVCKNTFKSTIKRQKLCSKKCVSKNKSNSLKHDDIIKNCNFCLKKYKARRERQIFCSKNCQYASQKKELIPRVSLECATCKIIFKRRITQRMPKNSQCTKCFKTARIGTKLTDAHKKRISETRLRDWSSGQVYKNFIKAHNGSFVKWYDHVKPNGESIKLQGTWEILYAKFLDKNKISYKAHEGAIWYLRSKDNTRRVYLPDFYLIDEDEYVDIKNDFIFNLEESKLKFIDIQKCNPKLKITIITKNDLIKLGLLKN